MADVPEASEKSVWCTKRFVISVINDLYVCSSAEMKTALTYQSRDDTWSLRQDDLFYYFPLPAQSPCLTIFSLDADLKADALAYEHGISICKEFGHWKIGFSQADTCHDESRQIGKALGDYGVFGSLCRCLAFW